MMRGAAAIVLAAVLAGCSRTEPAAQEYIEKGVMHVRAGHYRAALAAFQRALDSDPGNDLAYLHMAFLYEDHLNDRSNAVAVLMAYREAATSEFAVRVATRLLYAAELEALERSRQQFHHARYGGAPSTTDVVVTKNEDERQRDTLEMELLLAREKITMLEEKLRVLQPRGTMDLPAGPAALATAAPPVQARDSADFQQAQQRALANEDLLRRQTALVLHLEQRYAELQERFVREMALRAQLQQALDDLTGSNIIPRVKADEAAITATASGDIEHVVQPGDTLSGLALRYYGDRQQWMRIYIRNRSMLTTPDTLRQGQVIIIPR